jgi:hypothetical protein
MSADRMPEQFGGDEGVKTQPPVKGITPSWEIRQWALLQSSAAMTNWKDVDEWIATAEQVAQYICNGKAD